MQNIWSGKLALFAVFNSINQPQYGCTWLANGRESTTFFLVCFMETEERVSNRLALWFGSTLKLLSLLYEGEYNTLGWMSSTYPRELELNIQIRLQVKKKHFFFNIWTESLP